MPSRLRNLLYALIFFFLLFFIIIIIFSYFSPWILILTGSICFSSSLSSSSFPRLVLFLLVFFFFLFLHLLLSSSSSFFLSVFSLILFCLLVFFLWFYFCIFFLRLHILLLSLPHLSIPSQLFAFLLCVLVPYSFLLIFCFLFFFFFFFSFLFLSRQPLVQSLLVVAIGSIDGCLAIPTISVVPAHSSLSPAPPSSLSLCLMLSGCLYSAFPSPFVCRFHPSLFSRYPATPVALQSLRLLFSHSGHSPCLSDPARPLMFVQPIFGRRSGCSLATTRPFQATSTTPAPVVFQPF